MIVLVVAFLLVFVTGCAPINHVKEDDGNKTDDIDLSAILEVDSGQLNIEVELNHKNLISDKPQYFSGDNIQEKRMLTLNETECRLIYEDTLFYPVGSKTVHRYFVDGDVNKTILIDERGNINSILYSYTKLPINKTASPQDILESLKVELSKILDIAYYKHVKMSEPNQDTHGFGIYDYVFYNKIDEYMTDYFKVSVSDDGSVFGLSINNLATADFELDVDKEKENAAIEMKLKDIYDTNATQYRSYDMHFDPCIVQYNNQVYARYFVSAKYFHCTANSETNSFINSILIPLNDISN